jgi:hypothetical protein
MDLFPELHWSRLARISESDLVVLVSDSVDMALTVTLVALIPIIVPASTATVLNLFLVDTDMVEDGATEVVEDGAEEEDSMVEEVTAEVAISVAEEVTEVAVMVEVVVMAEVDMAAEEGMVAGETTSNGAEVPYRCQIRTSESQSLAKVRRVSRRRPGKREAIPDKA